MDLMTFSQTSLPCVRILFFEHKAILNDLFDRDAVVVELLEASHLLEIVNIFFEKRKR
jgi:hypothetical protein